MVNPLVFRWYLAPSVLYCFPGIRVSLSTVLTSLVRRTGRKRLGAQAVGLMNALLLLSSLNAYTLCPDQGPDRPAPEMAWFKLELHCQAAERAGPNLKPGDVVTPGDIGAVRWYAGAPILDTFGLLLPEALLYYPLDPSFLVINYAMSQDLIRDYQPDYLITLEVYVRESLLPARWFEEEYVLVQDLDTDVYGSDGMLIFERQR